LGGLLRGRFLVALLLERRSDHFLLAARDLARVVALAATAAATTTAAAGLLRLREFALERIDLDEDHVRLRLGARVLSAGVDAHEVARHQLEILQREHLGTRRLLVARLLEKTNGVLGTSVDGVVEVQILEPELVLRLDGERHFFDRARAVIAARSRDADFGWTGLARFDEVV